MDGFDVFVAQARRGVAEEREWTYLHKAEAADGTVVGDRDAWADGRFVVLASQRTS